MGVTTLTSATSHPESEAPRRIEYTRPRCPDCGSLRLKVRRSIPLPCGAKRRYTLCKDCGATFVVIAR